MGNEFEFFHKSPYGTLIWHIVCNSDAAEIAKSEKISNNLGDGTINISTSHLQKSHSNRSNKGHGQF